jgi:hypothetical protein
MDEPSHWGVSQYVTLAVVLMLHVFVLAALLLPRRGSQPSMPQSNAVELVFLAPAISPQVRRVNATLRHSHGDTALKTAPPVLDTPTLPMSSAAAGPSSGDGSGVDWRAEARRALQAFEIRNRQFSSNKSVSGRPEDDNWLPNAQHRAGEQLKTANGDWIVWINANCYEIASSGPNGYAIGAALPDAICRRHSGNAAQ